MPTKSFSRKYIKVFVIAFLLVLVGVSCLPSVPVATPIQTVVVLQQVITNVVTQIVYVPVTVTPTPTPYITDTPAATATLPPTAITTPPTATTTPVPPTITVQVHTQCLFGPDPAYIGRYDILANSQQVAIGRNQDTSWLLVQGSDHKYPCWVKAALVKVDTGSFTDPAVVNPDLTPYTTLYPPPPAVSANRVGNDVTIFWLPVPMSQQDYNGYLIEAWVCQGGQQVFVPMSYVTSFDKNSTMMAVKVTDEPGCSEPSSARIYSVTTNAYSSPKNVYAWPAAVTPTASATATP
jgi:hypothetical protein